jgi:hypothetical protein
MSLHRAEGISNCERNNTPSPSTLGPDYDGHNMVFVVGCPRSGTTWLQRLLASHPAIRTGQESHVFEVNIGPQLQAWRILADQQNRGGVGLACYFTEDKFLRIVKRYLLELLEPMAGHLAPGELFLEKSPAHALFLREIFELLPEARVIHVLRDPRDVVSSLLSGARRQQDWLSWWAPKHASEAANLWARHIRAVSDVVSEMPMKRFHEVRYEDLSRSPVEVLQGCLDFLDLHWDPHEIARAVEANEASKARANGGGTPIPLFGEAAKHAGSRVVEPVGFIRKGRPGTWKEDLSLYEKCRIWRAAHHLMDEVGYDWPKSAALTFACASACVDAAKRVVSPRRKKNRRN